MLPLASWKAVAAPASAAIAGVAIHDDDGGGGEEEEDGNNSSNKEAAASTCSCVIFRLDDVQDEWLEPVQAAIIDKFIEKNAPLDLAVIMNSIGNDPAIVTKVRQALATGLIETALHGWNHVSYANLTLSEQHDTLKAANEKMQDLFGRKSAIFVPPYNEYNENTLKAMNQLGLKIISPEFDSEIESIYNPDEPDSPDNKVYKAIAGGSDTIIKDQFGVYHLPQVIGFYTYDSDPPTKTPLSKIESQIDSAIASYGYAVVTLHPQDFTVKDAGNNPTEELSGNEIKDLDTLITWITDSGYSIQTFSRASHVPLPPIIDNVPPDITAPPDKAIVSSSKLTKVDDLGSPTVSDNADPSPSVKNDATTRHGKGAGSFFVFEQGTTKVTWTATDKAGNTSNATQYVTVASTNDTVAPIGTIDAPTNGTIIKGSLSSPPPSTNTTTTGTAGAYIQVRGTAFDYESGVKVVEVRTNDTEYEIANQVTPGSWSNWTATLLVTHSGDTEVEARVTDFFGNQKWETNVVKVSLDSKQ
ncbi:polysaccharide deacetylase family protein [Candidatus Nitrososphaera evergladensis]|nr:polysaccharide deacetylase family protein [Candidatus Nitrososphaera evergladensis]